MKFETTVLCDVCGLRTKTAFFKPHRLTTTTHRWVCVNCKSFYMVKVQLKKYNSNEFIIHQSILTKGTDPANPVDKSEDEGED